MNRGGGMNLNIFKRVNRETYWFFRMLVMSQDSSCVWLLVVPLCFTALHHRIEPSWMSVGFDFVRVKQTEMRLFPRTVKGVDFLARKGGKPWKKCLEKTIHRNSWMPGPIRITLTIRHIGQIPTTIAINWILTTKHTSKCIMPRDVTRSLALSNGHPIIPNTMINTILIMGKEMQRWKAVSAFLYSLFLNRDGCPKTPTSYDNIFQGLAKKYNKRRGKALPKVMTPHTYAICSVST